MKREAGANLYVMQLKLKKERMGTRRHVMWKKCWEPRAQGQAGTWGR
jgi:hypothetical protein